MTASKRAVVPARSSAMGGTCLERHTDRCARRLQRPHVREIDGSSAHAPARMVNAVATPEVVNLAGCGRFCRRCEAAAFPPGPAPREDTGHGTAARALGQSGPPCPTYRGRTTMAHRCRDCLRCQDVFGGGADLDRLLMLYTSGLSLLWVLVRPRCPRCATCARCTPGPSTDGTGRTTGDPSSSASTPRVRP